MAGLLDSGSDEGASGDEGAGAPPTLSDAAAARAFASLAEAADVVLQYLEEALPPEGAEESAARAEGPGEHDAAEEPAALALAAVRCLGRFSAEAPGAMGPRLRGALPRLLAAGGGAAGAPFLLPLLVQATDAPRGAGADEAAEAAEWVAACSRPAALAALAAHARRGAAEGDAGALAGVRVLARTVPALADALRVLLE
jgi:hypothetical protein